MKHIELYTRDELDRLGRKIRRRTAALIAVFAAATAVCAALCVLTTTGNAAAMERAAIAVFTPAGWFCLYHLRFTVLEGKHELTHGEMLLSGERETVAGVIALSPETLRIKNSIRIRRVTVTDGGASRRVTVNARKAALLEDIDGPVTLFVVNGYVAAYETRGGADERRDGDHEPPNGNYQARGLKNIFSRLHEYVLWLLVSVLLWSWIFTLVTDAPADRKVVVFADVYAVEDTALAVELETALPDGIRMVQVHPFSYAMFSDSALLAADIYIVRADDAAGWVDSFAPLDTVAFDPGGAAICDIGGVACGVSVDGAASSYITYAAPGGDGTGGAGTDGNGADEYGNDYYLFFNRDSVHTGKTDTAAIAVAEHLLSLD